MPDPAMSPHRTFDVNSWLIIMAAILINVSWLITTQISAPDGAAPCHIPMRATMQPAQATASHRAAAKAYCLRANAFALSSGKPADRAAHFALW